MRGVRSFGRRLDLASPRYGILGLSLLLLGVGLIGRTTYLSAGIIAALVGFTLAFVSGHYHFRKAELESARQNHT